MAHFTYSAMTHLRRVGKSTGLSLGSVLLSSWRFMQSRGDLSSGTFQASWYERWVSWCERLGIPAHGGPAAYISAEQEVWPGLSWGRGPGERGRQVKAPRFLRDEASTSTHLQAPCFYASVWQQAP